MKQTNDICPGITNYPLVVLKQFWNHIFTKFFSSYKKYFSNQWAGLDSVRKKNNKTM